MTPKRCVLADNKICDGCGECDYCDLNPFKLCDNCGKCIDADKEYREVKIDDIMHIDDGCGCDDCIDKE